MCRWVAYAGPEIYLEDFIFHQEYSIVSQSLAATQSAWVTNGDGFGVAWHTITAMQATLQDVIKVMDRHHSDEPMRISCALTNGREIWAVRYSSDDQSPSMYFGSPHTRANGNGLPSITTIASEPSDSMVLYE
jgi:predicted glutamine amidotransferase